MRKKQALIKRKSKTLRLAAYLSVGLLLTTLTGNTKASGEQTRIIDSLKTVIETADHDTTKAKALNSLAWELQYSHLDTSIILSTQALKIYEELNIQKGIGKSYHQLGTFHKDQGSYDSAFFYLERAVKIWKTLNNKKGMASSYNNIGTIYDYQSDYSQAFDYYFKSIKIKEELLERSGNPDEVGRLKQGMARTYNNIGIIYHNQSDYPQALAYYFKDLKIAEELGNKKSIAYSYNNIGLIYMKQSDYPQALDYYFKSIKIMEELSNKHAVATIYNNIGIFYANQSDYAQALAYYFKSLKIKEELGNKRGMAMSYTNIGSLYTSIYEQGDASTDLSPEAKAKGEASDSVKTSSDKSAKVDSVAQRVGGWARGDLSLLDTALIYLQKAYKLNRELHYEHNMVNTLTGIGSIYDNKNEHISAIQYYQEAVQLADSINALNECSGAHKSLAETYEKLNNHKLALEHYKQYSTLKDSVFNEEKSKDLGKLEAKHEMEMAEQERKRQEEEQQRILTEQTERRNLLQYSGILIFIVAFFITLLFSGRLNIPVRLAEGGVFFTFLLVFEFLLVLTDPYIEQYTGGEPAYKLIVNAGLAGLIFPLHSFFETKLKKRIMIKQKQKITKA